MKKKLLFRIGTLQAGGAERMLVDIINHLDTNLYDITLLLNVNHGIFKNELRKDINFNYLVEEVEFRFLSKYFPIISKIIRKIKHEVYSLFPFLIEKLVLKNKKFDTTICFLQDMADEVYKIKSPNKIIWIHIVLSDYFKENPKRKKYLKYLNKYDKIVAISNQVKQDLSNLLPELKTKIDLHLNPISKSLIIEKSESFYPPEYKNYQNKIKLVSVGRITYQKGFLRLADLKKILDNQNIDCEMFIVGMFDNKDYVNKLKSKMKELDVSIHLLGYKENPYPYIKNADIMIHPAVHEGYGLVLAESLILETPVIASNIKVFREFANDEIFYVTNDDDKFPKESLKAIKNILASEKKCKMQNTNIVDINEYVLKLKEIL